ncbi:MAG: DsrE family protein [Hoeflea sp.]|uniref:DsrE family protein n=1 Tax=Hoeflea sp. TaxID=1940281 RepID=UPI003297CAB8
MRLSTRILTAVTLTISLALAVFGNASANDRYGKQKVVYHINYDGGDADKAYRGALINIQNHINAVGAENIDIKLVLHGNGLGLLAHAKTNEALQGQVLGLKGQNVEINVCNNTLEGRNISYENDLFDVFKEDIVPSGVAELSRLQQMGYTYIKP